MNDTGMSFSYMVELAGNLSHRQDIKDALSQYIVPLPGNFSEGKTRFDICLFNTYVIKNKRPESSMLTEGKLKLVGGISAEKKIVTDPNSGFFVAHGGLDIEFERYLHPNWPESIKEEKKLDDKLVSGIPRIIATDAPYGISIMVGKVPSFKPGIFDDTLEQLVYVYAECKDKMSSLAFFKGQKVLSPKYPIFYASSPIDNHEHGRNGFRERVMLVSAL